ncbi:MAG: hypothetical protein MHM6MM_004577 [Cercozoa sp. M6MM]
MIVCVALPAHSRFSPLWYAMLMHMAGVATAWAVLGTESNDTIRKATALTRSREKLLFGYFGGIGQSTLLQSVLPVTFTMLHAVAASMDPSTFLLVHFLINVLRYHNMPVAGPSNASNSLSFLPLAYNARITAELQDQQEQTLRAQRALLFARCLRAVVLTLTSTALVHSSNSMASDIFIRQQSQGSAPQLLSVPYLPIAESAMVRATGVGASDRVLREACANMARGSTQKQRLYMWRAVSHFVFYLIAVILASTFWMWRAVASLDYDRY